MAANNTRRRDGSDSQRSERTAIGVFGKIASAITAPRADTRQWDSLPQGLSFAALRLPAGVQAATLRFFDANDQTLDSLTRQLTITVGDPAQDTVVILSELNL